MKFKHSLVLISTAALTACGGGGGGGEAEFTPPPTSAPLTITASNGQSATYTAWESANASVGVSDLLSNSGFISTGQLKPTVLPTTDFTNIVNKIPFGPTTLPCQVSGSITISGDLADPITPSLTEGDVINVDAASCDDGLGEVIDGMLGFDVVAFEGDIVSGLYDLTMAMTMTGFSVQTANETLTSNGDANVMLNTLSAPAVSAEVGGMSLTTQSGALTETLTNFLSAQTVDAGQVPAPYTFSSSGTLDSSQLAGTVTYTTPVTFAGFDNDYPQSGELLVTGASSSARLIALDAVNVRVEIDTDGDGTVDEVIDTTWAALDGGT